MCNVDFYMGGGSIRLAITVMPSMIFTKLRIFISEKYKMPNTEQKLPQLPYHRPEIVKYQIPYAPCTVEKFLSVRPFMSEIQYRPIGI